MPVHESVFGLALRKPALKREEAFKKLIDGFALDRGIVPKALTARIPGQPSSAFSNQLVSAWHKFLRSTTGSRSIEACHSQCKLLQVLVAFRVVRRSGLTELYFGLPTIDFGARVGQELGAGQLVYEMDCATTPGDVTQWGIGWNGAHEDLAGLQLRFMRQELIECQTGSPSMPDVFIKGVDMGDLVCKDFRTFAHTRLVL